MKVLSKKLYYCECADCKKVSSDCNFLEEAIENAKYEGFVEINGKVYCEDCSEWHMH